MGKVVICRFAKLPKRSAKKGNVLIAAHMKLRLEIELAVLSKVAGQGKDLIQMGLAWIVRITKLARKTENHAWSRRAPIARNSKKMAPAKSATITC